MGWMCHFMEQNIGEPQKNCEDWYDRRSGNERRIDGPDGFITGLYEPIDNVTPLDKLESSLKYTIKYREKRITNIRRKADRK